jgi:hypothetical protein
VTVLVVLLVALAASLGLLGWLVAQL